MLRYTSAWLFLYCVCAVNFSARADTVSLQPVADTFLQEAFPDNNLGGGTTVAAGERRKGGVTRALLLFDIASAVPAGATITSASLVVTVTSTPGGGADSNFDLHRITAAWGEGTGGDHFGGTTGLAGEATWNDRLGPGSPWNTPGGDFLATVSASKLITGNGVYTFTSTSTLINDVQGWLANATNNFGWELVSESESVPTSIRRFGSREDPSTAPRLLIQYSVPEPAQLPWLSLVLGVAILNHIRRGQKTEVRGQKTEVRNRSSSDF